MIYAKRNNKHNISDLDLPRGVLQQRRIVDGELAQIAGLNNSTTTDPVNRVIEHSRSMFDMIGRVNALKMAKDTVKKDDLTEEESEEKSEEESDEELNEKSKVGSDEEPSDTEETEEIESIDKWPDTDFYQKFSDKAFKNGNLISSVERGKGLTMLTSCIRNSMNLNSLQAVHEEGKLSVNATKKHIANSNSKLLNDRHARGALSVVVKTSQSLSNTLSVFERLATGEEDDTMSPGQINTAYKLYPFLNIKSEQEKLNIYNKQIAQLPEGDKKRALEYGANKLNSIITHKEHMKVEFLVELRQVIQNTNEAVKIFTAIGVLEEITQQLYDAGNNDDSQKNSDSQQSTEAFLFGDDIAGEIGNQNILDMIEENSEEGSKEDANEE